MPPRIRERTVSKARTLLEALPFMQEHWGKTIVVNLASPPISQTLTIQSVDISEIDISPGTAPRFHVVASNVRFSLDDLIRRALVAAEAA